MISHWATSSSLPTPAAVSALKDVDPRPILLLGDAEPADCAAIGAADPFVAAGLLNHLMIAAAMALSTVLVISSSRLPGSFELLNDNWTWPP
jgi:hypothetical protein